MTAQVFIDGEVGTTGLQIRERLTGRDDITLISLPEDQRKDASARRDALAAADVAILCLPDDAAREAVTLCQGTDTRLIDASTAHRVDPDWVYGFPEMTAGQGAAVAGAARVSNPGCYSTAAIALLRPLRRAGVIGAEAPVSIFGISGYSGGGKGMIAEFDRGESEGSFIYATGQGHKHLPEIVRHGLLDNLPIFIPSVGQFAQGMVVQIPLHPGMFSGSMNDVHAALAQYYRAGFVSVRPLGDDPARELPQAVNGTNRLELSVLGDAATGRVVLSAVLDNLGKGASGAAVQNLNLMLGLPADTGL
ncbi:N-acetyl-gamma-glutamyl-phosphate reductase [Oceaniglobus ichthyenteri]|uniref:N-acetyl-gamma-glutamyl-phosphate reductase n=1 Tax=Oceaniglobus ichthyenteri TaxID=2136177 RepID=UPI000D399029|nr:N-acetyl-gamma-glutamyl-phosphate reductase [Oceaniglobus ichthyenteri]